MSASTPQRPRRTRRASSPSTVPERLAIEQDSQHFGLSELNENTRAARQRIEERNALSLFELSNIESPITNHRPRPAPLSAVEEENVFDNRAYDENAGASDSEEEVEDDIDDVDANPGEPGQQDAHAMAAEDNLAVETLAGDFLSVEVKQEQQEEDRRWCFGAPPGWKPPMAPDDWIEAKPCNGQPDTAFESLDNPGNWGKYSFQPKFKYNKSSKGDYMYHALPTGVTPVPAKADGSRVAEGWNFNYQGWAKTGDAMFRETKRYSGTTEN